MEYYKTDYGWALGEEGQPPLGKIVVSENSASHLVIEHTEVDPSLQGRGHARQLVMLVVSEARSEGKLIVPRCPYSARLLGRDSELMALIAQS
ncbi:MAG: GNAT family N-acetyltransferase [Sphaerochaeta sp.]|jgi:predicted GNAT family acetyltransferase|nr:GNAT family N-acetyltransferase [Sphaerochaeta sp.]